MLHSLLMFFVVMMLYCFIQFIHIAFFLHIYIFCIDTTPSDGQGTQFMNYWIDIAVQRNVHNRLISSQQHLAQTWGQLLDLTIYGFGHLLATRSVLFPRECSSPSGPLFDVLQHMMCPMLARINSQSCSVDMTLLEPVAGSLLGCVHMLRSAHFEVTHHYQNPLAQREMYQFIIKQCFKALVTHDTSSSKATSSSAAFRNSLYFALMRLFAFVQQSDQSSTEAVNSILHQISLQVYLY